jgi:hypothetical protein
LHPNRFAGRRIKSFDHADAIRGVKHAVDQQRRRTEQIGETQTRLLFLELVRNRRPPPHDAQALDVVPIDSVERRILRASLVAAMIRPLAACRSSLSLRGEAEGEQDRRQSDVADATSHGAMQIIRARPDSQATQF